MTMRNVFFLFIALALITACSKDEFNPLKPKTGQKAELFLDHYVDVKDQRVLLLPHKESSYMSLNGFGERQLGYTYKVRAKVYVSPQHAMDDGVNSWFEFLGVLSKDKFTSDETFEIALVYPIGFYSGGSLAVNKDGNLFKYGDFGYNLRFVNREDMDFIEAMLGEGGIETFGNYQAYQGYLQKIALKAVVTHDPENYGKGYLVHSLKFNES